jgi:hypothetical protein
MGRGLVAQVRWRVELRRSNGRYVKHVIRWSRYSAKKVAQQWAEKYDEKSYYVEMSKE